MHNFKDLVQFFIGMVELLVPLVFGLTLLVITWKVVDTWIIHGNDAAKVEEGKNFLIVGVIALVVMSGVWGILNILQSSLFN
ncbi:MAG: hypothetical protein RLZZ76_187 [Candidatus Parcubacteria bacterium]|jgi:hypothetical protein